MTREIQFMKDNFMGFLATLDDTGMPRVRGWGIVIDEEGNICFATSNKKKVFQQLKKHAKAEWITMSKTMGTLRFSGEVVFETDENIKLDILNKAPMLKNHYHDKLDEFEIFYFENPAYNWFEPKR